MSGGRSLRRWLKSTSNRTFVLWPVLLILAQSALDGGWPRLNFWGLPLLAWGYAEYWWVGRYRTARGGGGPGLSNPPERLVTSGPYRFTRNPMYLGHLIFLAGLHLVTRSPVAAAVLVHLVPWFDRRAAEDERRLEERFGAPYATYRDRVPRWVRRRGTEGLITRP
jgi:protein-S-isoprenylcysteine O-methyltransferase Ste14